MILVVSTSSPQSSVAVLAPDRTVRAWSARLAAHDGHRSLFEQLDEVMSGAGIGPSDVSDVVVDVGPGGFTSVRIGVTFAKIFAHLTSCRIWSVESFDLIAREKTVVVPARRGEWLVRSPHGRAMLVRESPADALGYGHGIAPPVFPDAREAASARADWRGSDPVSLKPYYFFEPSISQPKVPYPRGPVASA